MYVYRIEDIECLEEDVDVSLLEKILNNGLATSLIQKEEVEAGYRGEWILAKENQIIIDGIEIESDWELEDFIDGFDGGEWIDVEGIQISKGRAIWRLTCELNQIGNDNNETYEEIIYNADFPFDKILELIDQFLLVELDSLLTNIHGRIRQINKQVEDRTFEWK